MKKNIRDRIIKLRNFMEINNIDAFIVPSTDAHSGEYIPEYWESRKWISGFTGSAGTVVITRDKAGLWTDSRYFIQAEEQLKDTGIILFKDKLPETPTVDEWIYNVIAPGSTVGIDGWVNSASAINSLRDKLKVKNIVIKCVQDPFIDIWKERPSLPLNEIFIHDLKFSGMECEVKIDLIRENLKKNEMQSILISALDEIAWTLNLRGNDVHCNPVFVSYLLITSTEVSLYIIDKKLTPQVREYLRKNNINIKSYFSLEEDLKNLSAENFPMQISPNINEAVNEILEGKSHTIPSPVLFLKSIKNDVEIHGFRNAMLRDGVAMVKFLHWIKYAVKNENESELSITDKLLEFRTEQDNFIGISFDTIAGYREHGAIVHYEADEESNKELKPEGMILLDSGAQYLDGTTDITRTIILGDITQEEKRDYTLVLKGMINLSMAEFPYGTCGTQLDVLARMPMWKYGINYMHGTGHGVGFCLNVHEGPHQFRMNHMPALLLPGMTITNEPGIYKAGRYGIRTENTMLIVRSKSTEFGEFYKFSPLTLCPIDKEGIDVELLSTEEIKWLNDYHQSVYDKISPLVDNDIEEWLKEATSPLIK